MKIFLFFLFFPFILFSQLEVKNYAVTINDSCLNCIIESDFKQRIIFFFPISKINKLEFEMRANQMVDELRKEKIDSTIIQFIYFKQNTKNFHKNLKFISSNQKDTLDIGYFKCLIKGIDSSLLFRSKHKMDLNFEINRSFPNELTFDVEMRDTSICIELMNRISLYTDFLTHVLSPKYSEQEQINTLNESLKNLNNQLKLKTSQLDEKIQEQDSEIMNLLFEIETLKSQKKRSKKNKKNE